MHSTSGGKLTNPQRCNMYEFEDELTPKECFDKVNRRLNTSRNMYYPDEKSDRDDWLTHTYCEITNFQKVE